MARLTPGKNGAVAILLFGVVSGMVGLSFAAVPLYRLFCQVTGYGGTTQVAEALPDQVGERIFTVRFNADLNQDMPWRFQPKQREVTLRVGEPGLAFYQAENLATAPVTGTATFNVTPLKVGPYFSKVDCFCFEEQRLAPAEMVDMGVSFFVDPAILEDPRMDDVKTITLSYTFFRALEETEEQAASPVPAERESIKLSQVELAAQAADARGTR
jgi:cytochrome c oxidase assembly protein subunit 11